MKLSELIRQEHFASPGHEALLNVMATSAWMGNEMSSVMAPYGITSAQYNVLRILRGSHPGSLTCSAIGERLLDRTPDVTRLLNRLERNGFIRRERAEHDRRVVEVVITQKGLDLLAAMQGDIETAQARIIRHLSSEEHAQLSDLLERLRSDQ